MPQKHGGETETLEPLSHTWAHVTATGAHNRRGTEENRKEMMHQRVPTDQASGSPLLTDDLMNTSNPPPTSVEQSDPNQPRRQILTPQEVVTHPDDLTPFPRGIRGRGYDGTRRQSKPTDCAATAHEQAGRRRRQTRNGGKRRNYRRA